MIADESVAAGSAYVEMICVDSDYRGKGIGKVLLDKAEAEARRNNCSVCLLFFFSNK